uniref:DNA_MISMATCH_REPAIR_2 domain-containing protein n=1 Tax=Elaeophora elaphi TaxID=1147741 RepID=A0A0R3RVS7_9BILA
MSSTSSFSELLVEESGLNKKCEEKAENDYYQLNSQSRTRFVLSNGELPEKQLHLLRHPKTGNATLYAIGNERVEELLKFDDGFRSVLLGNNVVSNGTLILLVPVNPALLLLPYLQKYAKADYVSLKDILVDDHFPSIKLLENVKAVKLSLKRVCHCKESDFGYAVRSILEENLPNDILKLVEIDIICEENENTPPNKRRKNQDDESGERRDKITGSGVGPLQATVGDMQTATVFSGKEALGLKFTAICQELAKTYCDRYIVDKFVQHPALPILSNWCLAMDKLDKGLMKIIRNKAAGTVVIFERNEFYACYDDDAIFIANNVFCSEVGLRRCRIGETELMYHVLNNAQYLRVIHDVILVQHYRVEVYAANDGQWELRAKGSLGCLNDFEEIVGDSAELYELTTVAALTVTEGHDSTEVPLSLFVALKFSCLVSVVSCNIREMQLTIAEFLDNEHFVNLEKCLAALVPRECLLVSSNMGISSVSLSGGNNSQLNTALKKAGIKKELFQFSEELPDLLSDQIAQMIDPKYKNVHFSRAQKSCLVGLIHHLHLSSAVMKNGKFQLRNYKSAGYMYLNSAAVKALELFCAYQEDEDILDDVGSLYELLNKCRTPQGQRLLREWIRRPLHDIRKINERLDVVEAFVNDSSCRVILHDDILRRIPDITAITRKLVQKKAGLQECYRLYQIIRLLKRFHEVLNELHASCGSLAPSVNDLCLEPLALAQLQFEKFMALIENTVDLTYFKESGLYRILPNIDENLLAAAERMDEIEAKCNTLLKKVCSGLTETVKLDNTEHHGFHFRVTLKAEKSIRQSGMQILETSKGSGVRFTCDDLDVLNREYLKLSSHYEAIQSSFVDMVLETCSGYVSTFCELSEAIAIIDTLVALSVLASGSRFCYVRPQILDEEKQILELRKCRHPVMEANPSSPQFISNDVILGSEQGDGAMFLMLTGANMGGKSTYLRCCALSILLAQMGSFVPCESARIGSCDYQCKGVSTFMAEMNDCASILESATCHSLVIVDELGRGTSTYDGFGLAWAIAEDIVSRVKCFCIYATHYHELTELGRMYPKQLKNICTTSQIDENGELILLYRITPGVAGRSFGLNIGKMIGLPDSVLQSSDCKRHAGEIGSCKFIDLDEEELYRMIHSRGDDELRTTGCGQFD